MSFVFAVMKSVEESESSVYLQHLSVFLRSAVGNPGRAPATGQMPDGDFSLLWADYYIFIYLFL